MLWINKWRMQKIKRDLFLRHFTGFRVGPGSDVEAPLTVTKYLQDSARGSHTNLKEKLRARIVEGNTFSFDPSYPRRIIKISSASDIPAFRRAVEKTRGHLEKGYRVDFLCAPKRLDDAAVWERLQLIINECRDISKPLCPPHLVESFVVINLWPCSPHQTVKSKFNELAPYSPRGVDRAYRFTPPRIMYSQYLSRGKDQKLWRKRIEADE